MTYPSKYAYLMREPIAPLLVRCALGEYGTLEKAGAGNNARILGWADEVANAVPTPYNRWAADWYNKDSIPWCGLFMAAMAVRSSGGRPTRMPPKRYLAALAWADWGEAVQFRGREGLRLGEIAVGDVAVFVRSGGGHVGIVVGISTDGSRVLTLGGNQSDRVNIAPIAVSRLYAVRRPPYMSRPAGARHVRLTSTGQLSTNER